MTVQEQNFEDLKREFYTNRSAPKASKLIRELSGTEMNWLLRHHREGGITNKETWRRDYFDFLLAYCCARAVAIFLERVVLTEPPF